MKKFIFLILPLTILVSCGMFKSITVEDLRIGMSKEDVRQMYGPPKKILSVSQTDFGLQEILEYKTVNSELYTLEFMDNRLVSYGYIGDDINYVPPPAQPVVIVEPVYPLPPPPPPAIHPAPRPERPRPPQTQPRPETKPQRPSNTTPSHRPTESAPSRPSAPREPENSSTRPGKPSESTRTSGRTESTGSNRSSGESNRQTVKQEPSRSSSNSSGGGRR